MKTPSKQLALCEGNPSVTDGLASQRANNAELWCFLWCIYGPQRANYWTHCEVTGDFRRHDAQWRYCSGHDMLPPSITARTATTLHATGQISTFMITHKIRSLACCGAVVYARLWSGRAVSFPLLFAMESLYRNNDHWSHIYTVGGRILSDGHLYI